MPDYLSECLTGNFFPAIPHLGIRLHQRNTLYADKYLNETNTDSVLLYDMYFSQLN